MTRPLSDWLGLRCQYRGWLDTWEKLQHNQTRYLFRDVEILPWGKPLSEIRKIHHLWFYHDDDQRITDGKTQRFRIYSGCGDVIEYRRRKTGSIDYAINADECCDLHRCIKAINSGKLRPKRAIEILQYVLKSLDDRKVLTSWGDNLDRHRGIAMELLDRYQKQAALQNRYMENAQLYAHGKPRIDILQKPVSIRTTPKGFAKK